MCLITTAFELPSGSTPGLHGNTFDLEFLIPLLSVIFLRTLQKKEKTISHSDYMRLQTQFMLLSSLPSLKNLNQTVTQQGLRPNTELYIYLIQHIHHLRYT